MGGEADIFCLPLLIILSTFPSLFSEPVKNSLISKGEYILHGLVLISMFVAIQQSSRLWIGFNLISLKLLKIHGSFS